MNNTIVSDAPARTWADVGESELSAISGGVTDGGCVSTITDLLKLIFHGLGLPQA